MWQQRLNELAGYCAFCFSIISLCFLLVKVTGVIKVRARLFLLLTFISVCGSMGLGS